MSRCYPYPPPGYIKNGIRDEALIESIKLCKREEKAKKESKIVKKREKKVEERKNGIAESKKHSHKRRHKDERSQGDQKGGDHQKRRENKTEHFEKSSLTEEHGHPVGSQISTDSTLNSNKRHKQSSPCEGQHNPGSIIRIKLPLRRHKDPEVLPSNEQPCSASDRGDDISVQEKHKPAPITGRQAGEHSCSVSGNSGLEHNFRISQGKPCSSSGAPEITDQKAKAAWPANLCGGCSPGLALKTRDLIENWVAPPLQSESTNSVNEDWLFKTKQNQNKETKRREDNGVSLGGVDPTPWPRLCYLPEVDIYALPFAVPF
ncbi:hypothetical protein CFOL_v3_08346 [Cephalotus follicularis]|uniref:Uncharacterized protein n=1 Tax=Cephalotus follicularis TaxID=3775 RepID=A0A1Q3B9Y5_CEPFO|nr:hypothetical protein CFOL_v3_08346 [Cephalotus follicularis]